MHTPINRISPPSSGSAPSTPRCACTRRGWLALALVAAFEVTAQGGSPNYVIRKQAIGAGGSTEAGTLRLNGTVGEPAAAVLSGGSYRLTAGFHAPRIGARPDAIFSDGFEESP